MAQSIMSMKWAGAAALTLAALSGPALAGGSVKDAPVVDQGRKFTWSFNIGATSDYVFRGVSQSAEDPVIQGGIDVGYGILYAGVWASGIDFGRDFGNTGTRGIAHAEVDWYAGIKPVLGPVTFDLGVIYYTYPGALDGGPAVAGQPPEQDYVEIKVGASASFVPNLTTGIAVFYSPEYTGKQGETVTVEGAIAYELPKVASITPTIGGVIGSVMGDASDPTSPFLQANGKDSYLYWNVGLALAIDKLTLDFRYWDTDISNTTAAPNFCTGRIFQCDERFVFTAKVTLP